MRAVLFAAAAAQLVFEAPADEAEVAAAEAALRAEAALLTGESGLASPTLCDPKVNRRGLLLLRNAHSSEVMKGSFSN